MWIINALKHLYGWMKGKFRAFVELLKFYGSPIPPEEASTVIYPLNTWKRTQTFFDEIMEMVCDCPKCYMSMDTVQDVLDAGPDEHGYLGMRATTLKCDPCPECGCLTCKVEQGTKPKKIVCSDCGVENGRIAIVAYRSIVECQRVSTITPCPTCKTETEFRYDQDKKQFYCLVCEKYIDSRPHHGDFKYRLEFDPNNGFIQTKWHEGMEESLRLWVTDNPDYEDYLKLTNKEW